MAQVPQTESHAFPHVMIGASSPLWAYFGSAAAGGAAYWWMTRWTRLVNVEAQLAVAAAPAPIEAAPADTLESIAVEAPPPAAEPPLPIAAEAVAELAGPVVAPDAVEADPEADRDLLAETAPDIAPEAVADPAPEAVAMTEDVLLEAPVVAEAAAPSPAKTRSRKAAPPADEA